MAPTTRNTDPTFGARGQRTLTYRCLTCDGRLTAQDKARGQIWCEPCRAEQRVPGRRKDPPAAVPKSGNNKKAGQKATASSQRNNNKDDNGGYRRDDSEDSDCILLCPGCGKEVPEPGRAVCFSCKQKRRQPRVNIVDDEINNGGREKHEDEDKGSSSDPDSDSHSKSNSAMRKRMKLGRIIQVSSKGVVTPKTGSSITVFAPTAAPATVPPAATQQVKEVKRKRGERVVGSKITIENTISSRELDLKARQRRADIENGKTLPMPRARRPRRASENTALAAVATTSTASILSQNQQQSEERQTRDVGVDDPLNVLAMAATAALEDYLEEEENPTITTEASDNIDLSVSSAAPKQLTPLAQQQQAQSSTSKTPPPPPSSSRSYEPRYCTKCGRKASPDGLCTHCRGHAFPQRAYLYALRKSSHLCVRCGKRPPQPSDGCGFRCLACYTKDRQARSCEDRCNECERTSTLSNVVVDGRCERCREVKARYGKKAYQAFKEAGVCTRCRRAKIDVANNSRLCHECLSKDRANKKSWRRKIKVRKEATKERAAFWSTVLE
ncbi:hypothetical protein F5Y16DRAFT_425208 [Xylariaceae sp. FL0255]|nr:hypothetical protein F5Y16DRAFT_425208 [Xylariaceae sp. FL0255]